MTVLFLLILAHLFVSANTQLVLHVANRNRGRQTRKKDDYTFDSKLRRATEECSYFAQNDNDSNRQEAIQRIKNDMNNRRVPEQKTKKKKKSNSGVKRPNSNRGSPTNQPSTNIIKRSPSRKQQKKKKEPSFSQGTFKDHNNCFSRCVFARMELVDFLGFPQESTLRKALEDSIDNRKIRAVKLKWVFRCFDEVKKVAIDDNCIYATRIFKCMKLDQPDSWSR